MKRSIVWSLLFVTAFTSNASGMFSKRLLSSLKTYSKSNLAYKSFQMPISLNQQVFFATKNNVKSSKGAIAQKIVEKLQESNQGFFIKKTEVEKNKCIEAIKRDIVQILKEVDYKRNDKDSAWGTAFSVAAMIAMSSGLLYLFDTISIVSIISRM